MNEIAPQHKKDWINNTMNKGITHAEVTNKAFCKYPGYNACTTANSNNTNTLEMIKAIIAHITRLLIRDNICFYIFLYVANLR